MSEEKFLAGVTAFLLAAVGGVILSVPIGLWASAGITQKALNKECGTNYSQWDTLWAGESLTELCRIKQQELLIKQ